MWLGTVKSCDCLMAAQCLLRLCEVDLLGVMVFYLSTFNNRYGLLFRLGTFSCAAPLSGAFAGPRVAKIQFHEHDRWS